MDKTIEKVIDNQNNQNVGNSNITCTSVKFLNFLLMINKVILSNLHLW